MHVFDTVPHRNPQNGLINGTHSVHHGTSIPCIPTYQRSLIGEASHNFWEIRCTSCARSGRRTGQHARPTCGLYARPTCSRVALPVVVAVRNTQRWHKKTVRLGSQTCNFIPDKTLDWCVRRTAREKSVFKTPLRPPPSPSRVYYGRLSPEAPINTSRNTSTTNMGRQKNRPVASTAKDPLSKAAGSGHLVCLGTVHH